MTHTPLVLTLLVAAGVAGAQTKITGTGKCGKADKQEMIEVGDRANHAIMIMKVTCIWTAPMEMGGLKSKSYTVSMMSDSSGEKSQDRGYVVVTMENGDKAFVKITNGAGTSTKDGKMTGEGSWVYTGGTGKLRGLTGKGTYKTSGTMDTGEDQVEGEYSLPAPSTSKAKKD
jgi:hypothetical protein